MLVERRCAGQRAFRAWTSARMCQEESHGGGALDRFSGSWIMFVLSSVSRKRRKSSGCLATEIISPSFTCHSRVQCVLSLSLFLVGTGGREEGGAEGRSSQEGCRQARGQHRQPAEGALKWNRCTLLLRLLVSLAPQRLCQQTRLRYV